MVVLLRTGITKSRVQILHVAEIADCYFGWVARCLQSIDTITWWFSWIAASVVLYKRRVVLYFFSNTSSTFDQKEYANVFMTAASPFSKSSYSIHMTLEILAPESDMMNVMFCPVFRCDWLKPVIAATMFPNVTAMNHQFYVSLFRKVLPKRTMSLLVFGASCKKPICWKQCVVREIKTLYEVCMCFDRCAVIRQMGI